MSQSDAQDQGDSRSGVRWTTSGHRLVRRIRHEDEPGSAPLEFCPFIDQLIPSTTSTEPVQRTIAGHKATYLEFAIAASLPCGPSQFYLWQDSAGNYHWAHGLSEVWRSWILEVGGQRVVIVAKSYPSSTEEAKAEQQGIIDSIVFEVGS